MVLTKSEDQLMPLSAENVKTANGQYIFQTTRELNVSWDHLLNATASQSNHKMDMLANHVNMDSDKTQ